MINHDTMLELKRWNTPTIYNGWELITKHSRTSHFNREPVTDFMPNMGPMVGRAVTVVIEPSNGEHIEANTKAWEEYRTYVASVHGPKIVVVQDRDKPYMVGAFWGEVNSNTHRALGCVGTITDGAIRDVDEMHNAGFKALSQGFCVGHAYSYPVEWNVSVEVFGTRVDPGQLIHADKHGFLIIPEEDEENILHAAQFMDANECKTVLPAARSGQGKPIEELLEDLNRAGKQFSENAMKELNRKGEW
jgi:4-hydroxy-4-methyl-2-oxoglutarate aldolase